VDPLGGNREQGAGTRFPLAGLRLFGFTCGSFFADGYGQFGWCTIASSFQTQLNVQRKHSCSGMLCAMLL